MSDKSVRTKHRQYFWWGVIAILAAHAALFFYGVRHPDAMLKYDRAVARLRDAESLAMSPDFKAAATKLAGPGTVLNSVGDYAWHGLVLFGARGWTPAIQIVQLSLHVIMLVGLYRLTFYLTADSITSRNAVLIKALIPIDFAMPHFVSSEAFSTPFLVLGVLFAVAYATRGLHVYHLAAAGFCFGLSLITRGILLAWLPLMFVYVLWLHVANRRRVLTSLGHLLLLFVCLFSLQFTLICVKSFLPSESNVKQVDATFEPGNVGITNQFAHRTKDIYVLVGDREQAEKHDKVKREGGVPAVAFRDYCDAAWHHPASFVRLWVNHAIKFTCLPSNLDICRYLNLYEYDAQRSRRVDGGWRGAVSTTFQEMPVLVSVLLLMVLAFLMLLLLSVFGVATALRLSSGNVQIAIWGMISLPIVYLMLRCLVTGISRKREPVDFVIAFGAAVGISLLARRKEFLASIQTVNER